MKREQDILSVSKKKNHKKQCSLKFVRPRLKVSEIEADGCVPLSQTRFAKRGVAESVPVVDMDGCKGCAV